MPRDREGGARLRQRRSSRHRLLETFRPPPNVPWVMLVSMTDVAALIGDSTRAAMLDALMDGEARPAGELARRAGVAPSTASEHLARLVEGRVLSVEPRGRERRYRLASVEVAEVLEALSCLGSEAPVSSLRAAGRNEALRAARTCYDH